MSNDELKKLLAEAQDLCTFIIKNKGGSFGTYAEVIERAEEVRSRIDTALVEPVPEPLIWHRVYNSRSKYYAMKRELICFVEHSELLQEAYWHITLANGKQDHVFRHGSANTIEEAKESAAIALAAM
jgi:hypothetical protein